MDTNIPRANKSDYYFIRTLYNVYQTGSQPELKLRNNWTAGLDTVWSYLEAHLAQQALISVRLIFRIYGVKIFVLFATIAQIRYFQHITANL